MRLYEKKEKCCGCYACAECCPAGAIRMHQDREGFPYPKIIKSRCIECGKCEKVCPLKQPKDEEHTNLYFGARVKDDKQRYAASSGGIFGLLAQYVLEKQGVVYAAGYSGKMKVVHKEAANEKQLENLKKTKYVQSDLSGVYRKIEENLRDDKWVLFCGTPCQAQALIFFLKKEYERLIIADLVCYGVPSPGVWNDYVAYLESKHNGKMSEFYFRDKRNHDNGHTRSYRIDGKEYAASIHEDFFCKMYFRNLMLRPSCYACKFCTTDRSSDFTLGDFWGIEQVKPEMDDGMGCSLVISHTHKAKAIWDAIRKETVWFECTQDDLMQPRLSSPTRVSENRWKFMMSYRYLPFSTVVKLFDR